MQIDSSIVSTLIGIGAGILGSFLSWQLASLKTNSELEKQDIRITEAIKRLEERLADYRLDLKELEKETIGNFRELGIKVDDRDRHFRSLINFLAGKGLHYRERRSDRETLS